MSIKDAYYRGIYDEQTLEALTQVKALRKQIKRHARSFEADPKWKKIEEMEDLAYEIEKLVCFLKEKS